MRVRSSFIHNSSKLETAQLSITRGLDIEIIQSSYSGQTTDMATDVDKSQAHLAEQKNDTKCTSGLWG